METLMPGVPKPPLTEHDYEKINAALGDLERAHQDIAVALKAGFDCAPEDQLCQQLKDRLTQIKAAYFPERP